MFDLEKFKTGKYFVHLPTEDIYRDTMEFLEKEGFCWVGEKSMKVVNPWFKNNKHFCIRYDVHEKAVVDAGYGYYRDSTPFKELPINKRFEDLTIDELISISNNNPNYKIEYVGSIDLEGKPNDLVKSPNHYIGELGLEVEEVLRNFIPRYEDGYVAHRMASAIEYLLRAPLKNGEQDLEKAGYNIQQALEHIRKKEEK